MFPMGAFGMYAFDEVQRQEKIDSIKRELFCRLSNESLENILMKYDLTMSDLTPFEQQELMSLMK